MTGEKVGDVEVEQAEAHIDNLEKLLVIPIPAVLLLGQALVSPVSETTTTAADEAAPPEHFVDILGMKLGVEQASIALGLMMVVILLLVARSVWATVFLLRDARDPKAVQDAVAASGRLINPFHRLPETLHPGLGRQAVEVAGSMLMCLFFGATLLVDAALFDPLLPQSQIASFSQVNLRSSQVQIGLQLMRTYWPNYLILLVKLTLIACIAYGLHRAWRQQGRDRNIAFSSFIAFLFGVFLGEAINPNSRWD